MLVVAEYLYRIQGFVLVDGLGLVPWATRGNAAQALPRPLAPKALLVGKGVQAMMMLNHHSRHLSYAGSDESAVVPVVWHPFKCFGMFFFKLQIASPPQNSPVLLEINPAHKLLNSSRFTNLILLHLTATLLHEC